MGREAVLVCLDAGLNRICLFFFSPTDRHLGVELWFDNGCGSAWGCGPFPCTQRHPVDAHEQSAWIHRDCPWPKGQEENRYCHSHKCNWAGKRWCSFKRSAVVALFPKTMYWLFPLFPIWTKDRIPVDCIILHSGRSSRLLIGHLSWAKKNSLTIQCPAVVFYELAMTDWNCALWQESSGTL